MMPRAFHHSGMHDRQGFAALACLELLVHTADAAEGLGLAVEPPESLARAILRELFEANEGQADPWTELLWATGRLILPGRELIGSEWELRTVPTKVV